MSTKKLERFLDTVGENTEKQIIGLRDMRHIINYDAIIVSSLVCAKIMI